MFKDLQDECMANIKSELCEKKVDNLIEQIVEKAISYLGVEEYNGRKNDVVFNTDYYGKNVTGLEYPWCVVFLWDIFRMCDSSPAFYDAKRVDECVQLYDWGIKANLTVELSAAKRGDIVLFDWDATGIPEHVGLFLSHMDDDYIRTVEGCTSNEDNSANTVMIKQRKSDLVYAVIRPEWDKVV